MKRIRLTDDNDDSRAELADAARIQRALLNLGYEADILQCRELWRRYSDSMSAGWMMLPETDSEIYACVAAYFEVDE